MNIIYLGKYTLNDFHASAGSKRVLNQISYLKKHNKITIITLSKYSSTYKENINFKRYDNKLIYLLTLPLYWLLISFLLVLNKQKGKNIILLESIVELNFCIPILVSKILGYRVVHDVVENFFLFQESSKFQKKNNFVTYSFFNHLNSYADGIIVISNNLINTYSEFKYPMLKLYNSVSFKLPSKNDIQIPANIYFTYLYSGTFGIKDGVKDLIHAFNKVSEKYPNTKLILTGGNNSKYFNECIELIKCNEKITYLGYLNVSDLQIEYRKADVLMVVRDNSDFANNGFPYKLSEYLSNKKPVISSSVSDIPLLFSDYHDLLLSEPSNIESIIEKMEYSYTHRDYLEQLALNGYFKAKNYFSINKNGKKLNTFLETL